jgi:hypothetical protein
VEVRVGEGVAVGVRVAVGGTVGVGEGVAVSGARIWPTTARPPLPAADIRGPQ